LLARSSRWRLVARLRASAISSGEPVRGNAKKRECRDPPPRAERRNNTVKSSATACARGERGKAAGLLNPLLLPFFGVRFHRGYRNPVSAGLSVAHGSNDTQ